MSLGWILKHNSWATLSQCCTLVKYSQTMIIHSDYFLDIALEFKFHSYNKKILQSSDKQNLPPSVSFNDRKTLLLSLVFWNSGSLIVIALSNHIVKTTILCRKYFNTMIQGN